jgi:hypothetical protein
MGTPIADSLDRTEQQWRHLEDRRNSNSDVRGSVIRKQTNPPERPPKKAHLRGDSTTPPVTPPRGATPSSRPPSRTSSNATPPSRGNTPTSSVLRANRPKFPSPPGSPEKSSRIQDLPLPPPPTETSFDYDTPIIDTPPTSTIQNMPLPAPPMESDSMEGDENPTLR